MYPDSVRLAPEHGKGYAELSVRLLVTTPGRTTRDLATTAMCSAPTRCEHKALHRQEGEPPSHAISLSDASIARLSQSGGTVAIRPLFLKAPKDTTVTVTLTLDGYPAVTRRVSYLASEADSAPARPPASPVGSTGAGH